MKRSVSREYTESFVVAIVLALVLRFFVISAYRIPTGSMVPTLKVGDFIFAYKLPYGLPIPFSSGDRIGSTLPARGDVVVFRYPANPSVSYVKRVVGLPGDRVSIKNKQLYINEIAADYTEAPGDVLKDLPGSEFYAVMNERYYDSTHFVMRSKADETEFFGPIVVPPGQIFVLGDNRDSSDDSRYWGSVPVQNLEGRVILIWMSFDWLNRWAEGRFPTIRWDRVLIGVR
jgi:signal peptidase I